MKTIEVVAAVIEKDNKYFATQRGWEFPGGKMEAGETPQQALVREIKEELDTEIQVGDFLTTVEYDYPNFHLTMHCYMCTVIKGKLSLLEHEAAKWLSVEKLESVDWLPADVVVVKALQNYINLTKKG